MQNREVMKHNTCPHCGARITFRQRFFAKKGEIHCGQCGGVCYFALTVFLFSCLLFQALMSALCWDLPRWERLLVAVAGPLVLLAFNPLRVRKPSVPPGSDNARK